MVLKERLKGGTFSDIGFWLKSRNKNINVNSNRVSFLMLNQCVCMCVCVYCNNLQHSTAGFCCSSRRPRGELQQAFKYSVCGRAPAPPPVDSLPGVYSQQWSWRPHLGQGRFSKEQQGQHVFKMCNRCTMMYWSTMSGYYWMPFWPIRVRYIASVHTHACFFLSVCCDT